MTDNVESDAPDESCDTDYDIDCDIESSSKSDRKRIRKNANGWCIDKTRLFNLHKVSLLPIPQHAVEILSKLILNHQLLEIGKIWKVSSGRITFFAIINLKSAAFRDLDSDDVIVKVFTGEKFEKLDIKNAKAYRALVYSEKRHKEYYSSHYYNNGEELVIFQQENVVITKMIGSNKPAPNLIQMIKLNPHKIKYYYEELIKLIKLFRGRDWHFWNGKSSARKILWDNGEWNFIDHGENIYCEDKHIKYVANNYVSLMKIFRHYGLSNKHLKAPFLNFTKRNSRDYYINLRVLENFGHYKK